MFATALEIVSCPPSLLWAKYAQVHTNCDLCAKVRIPGSTLCADARDLWPWEETWRGEGGHTVFVVYSWVPLGVVDDVEEVLSVSFNLLILPFI